MSVRILNGDCREVLQQLPDRSVQCCVTSPPYYQLRDYDMPGQIGLEATPELYVAELVKVFREVRRVLVDEGTLWLNLGDSYASRPNGSTGKESSLESSFTSHTAFRRANALRSGGLPAGLKHKDLIGIPWMVAFALRADGWFLRQEIIWAKPNAMPESIKDRCTKAHEHVFLLSKQPRYFYDADAIAEEATADHDAGNLSHKGTEAFEAGDIKMRTRGGLVAFAERQRSKRNSFARATKYSDGSSGQKGQHRPGREDIEYTGRRNKRSVWMIPTKPFRGAHFAVMAPDVVRNCILAGCPVGGTVLDPFGGAGTTGLVADQLQRHAVLIELNPQYTALSDNRITGDAPLFASVTA